MRPALPPLIGLQAFEAAARTGSFAAAAAELNLSPAAVSHRIRSLETHLGVPLFDRGARGVSLTSMGRTYLPSVRASFDDLAVSTGGLFGPVRRHQLTVRAQVSFVTTWLAPRLQDFRDRHPHIELRVLCAIWADAYALGGVDIDIRQRADAETGDGAELLHRDHAVVIHSPEHEHRYGPVRSAADLVGRPRVHVLGFDDLWQQLWNTHGLSDSGQTITVDTSITAIEIAATSTSLALVSERYARPALRAGRVRAGLDPIPMRQGHVLVRPRDAPEPSPEARIFERWLRDRLDTDDAHPEPATLPASTSAPAARC